MDRQSDFSLKWLIAFVICGIGTLCVAATALVWPNAEVATPGNIPILKMSIKQIIAWVSMLAGGTVLTVMCGLRSMQPNVRSSNSTGESRVSMAEIIIVAIAVIGCAAWLIVEATAPFQ